MQPKSFLPTLAFEALKEAEKNYSNTGSFAPDNLETLHSFFDDTLKKASEMLHRNCKVYRYSTSDKVRSVYQVVTHSGQYTLYDNINFCACESFQLNVLESRIGLTCEHVLLMHLARITKVLTDEIISPNQFEEFLNGQVDIQDR